VDVSPLEQARLAAAMCKACELWACGTQTVFGEGPANAEVMLVGEQPGDTEDRAGRPFVGPAGRVLDQALAQAGIDRHRVYVTNAVKHFKWEARGKRRLHKRPDAAEVAACRPWLDREIELVRPRVVVCLGATAAQALLGRSFKVTEQRGRLFPQPAGHVVAATVHPSSVLRARDAGGRQAQLAALARDLRTVADHLA
jgi:uracil-DNA glycosylase family protein